MAKVTNTDSNFQATVRSMLESGKATVTFTKKDGTLRTMKCSTNTGLVPTTATIANHEGVQTVYDLDINEWRSFRWDSVQSAESIDG
jgi:hypothetical protein